MTVAVALGLGACTSARVDSPAASPDGSSLPAPSGGATRSITVVRLPQAEPAEREEAAIAFAFDPSAGGQLAHSLPTDLDWDANSVVCIYLGRRAEGGWGLAIQSANLVGGELRILARETRPAAGVDRPGPTYPADCATIDRAALPVGPLAVRADDTVSDEFIVSAEVEVPAP